MYHFVKSNRDINNYIGIKQTNIKESQKFNFISVNVDEARLLLRSAREETEKNHLNKAVQISNNAILLVISQLLKYFVTENIAGNLNDMLKILNEKGVMLFNPQNNCIRLEKITKKAIDGGSLTKEETYWVLNFADFIIEKSKEVKID